jgi:hypothetical protein
VRLRSCGGAQLLRRVQGRRRERTLSCPILYMMLPCTDACAWSTRSRCVICAAHTRPHHPSVWRAAQHYGRSRASRMACATAVCDLGRNGKRQSAKRTIPSVSSHCCACAGQNSPSTPRSRARSRIAGRRRAPSSDLPAKRYALLRVDLLAAPAAAAPRLRTLFGWFRGKIAPRRLELGLAKVNMKTCIAPVDDMHFRRVARKRCRRCGRAWRSASVCGRSPAAARPGPRGSSGGGELQHLGARTRRGRGRRARSQAFF